MEMPGVALPVPGKSRSAAAGRLASPGGPNQTAAEAVHTTPQRSRQPGCEAEGIKIECRQTLGCKVIQVQVLQQ